MRRLVSLFIFAALVGCGSSERITAPPVVPLSLNISTPATQRGTIGTSNGFAVYQCTFEFVATASGGSAGETAAFGDGEIDWRLISNGSTTTSFLGPTDFQDWFGVDRINAGASAAAVQTLHWSGPFTALVVIRYSLFTEANPFGEGHTANIPVTCT